MKHKIPLILIPNDDWTYTVLSTIFNIVTEWDNLDEAIENWKNAISCHIEWILKDNDKNSIEYDLIKSLDKSMNLFVTV